MFKMIANVAQGDNYGMAMWRFGALRLHIRIDKGKRTDRACELWCDGWGQGQERSIAGVFPPEQALKILKTIIPAEDILDIREEFRRLGWEVKLEDI